MVVVRYNLEGPGGVHDEDSRANIGTSTTQNHGDVLCVRNYTDHVC